MTDQSTKPRVLAPDELIGPLNEFEQLKSPRQLYIQGPMEIPLPGPRVSIVGTRRPTAEGVEMARTLAKSLVKNGVIIVSGLAEGIDTVAHETAIEEGGQTIAVLGTSLDSVYPKKNAELQRVIGQHHLLISQFKTSSRVWPSNFIDRNRTMALVSNATLIIEAGEDSGSRHQGWEAIRLGRPLFLSRLITENPSLKWPEQMIHYGAALLQEPEELHESLPSQKQRILIEMDAVT